MQSCAGIYATNQYEWEIITLFSTRDVSKPFTVWEWRVPPVWVGLLKLIKLLTRKSEDVA